MEYLPRITEYSPPPPCLVDDETFMAWLVETGTPGNGNFCTEVVGVAPTVDPPTRTLNPSLCRSRCWDAILGKTLFE